MVVLGVELAGFDPEISSHIGDAQSTTLQQDQGICGLVMHPPEDACHHVNDLTEVYGAEARGLGPFSQLALDVDCSRLIKQEGDDRLGVEDGQRATLRRSVLRCSSSRVRRRASSEAPRSLFLRSTPRAAAMGSDGKGR